jgi:hypothetical protein
METLVEKSLGIDRITDEADINTNDAPDIQAHIALRSSERFDDFFFSMENSVESRWDLRGSRGVQ